MPGNLRWVSYTFVENLSSRAGIQLFFMSSASQNLLGAHFLGFVTDFSCCFAALMFEGASLSFGFSKEKGPAVELRSSIPVHPRLYFGFSCT